MSSERPNLNSQRTVGPPTARGWLYARELPCSPKRSAPLPLNKLLFGHQLFEMAGGPSGREEALKVKKIPFHDGP